MEHRNIVGHLGNLKGVLRVSTRSETNVRHTLEREIGLSIEIAKLGIIGVCSL